jgi:hypothetical protein
LPEDIRSLVDHQAAVVTTAGFRNEMRGLARDIRLALSPWPWVPISASVGGLVVLLIVGWFAVIEFEPRPQTEAQPSRETTIEAGRNEGSTEPLRGSISFKSERGDYIGQGKSWKVTDADGNLTATVGTSSVSIIFHGDDIWDLDFVAPLGQRVQLGSYDNATRAPFNSPTKPGLSISGAGRACNISNGSFRVRQIAYSESGAGLSRFVADFVQHCEGDVPALTGVIDVSAAPK